MTMNCFWYPGNKARHAKWILEFIPEHTCYVEPFGGAAGVLFNKPRSDVEVLNDLDGDIVHFFEVLRDRNEELQEWLEYVPFSRELYHEWADMYFQGYRPTDDIERAGRWFTLRYMQFGGKYHTKMGFTYSKQTNHARPFVNKAKRLDEFAERLRGVYIENEDWKDVCRRYDGEDTLFYFDPPYEETEYQYGAEGFDHDEFFHHIDHNLEGSFILSHDSVPSTMSDRHVEAKDTNFRIDNVSSDEVKEVTEYLIMNFNPDEVRKAGYAGTQSVSEFDF